jgi:hypothetical protein
VDYSSVIDMLHVLWGDRQGRLYEDKEDLLNLPEAIHGWNNQIEIPHNNILQDRYRQATMKLFSRTGHGDVM